MRRLLMLLTLCGILFLVSGQAPEPTEYIIIAPENNTTYAGSCVNISITTLANTTLGVVPVSTQVHLNTSLGWFNTANGTAKSVDTWSDRNGTLTVQLCSDQPGIAEVIVWDYLGYNTTKIEFIEFTNVTPTETETVPTEETTPTETTPVNTTVTAPTETVTTVTETTVPATTATVNTTTAIITTIPTTVETTSETTPTKAQSTPGFEASLAIIGLLIVMFMLRRRE